jgi:NarL family two-component system response regulator LiaR
MRKQTNMRSDIRSRPLADRSTIQVLIADDHAIVRKGIRALLATEPGIEVVGEASNGQEVLAIARQMKPDIVLMDLVMPGMDGLEATRLLTAQLPQIHILVLTSFDGDDSVFPAIKAGALGYLLKDTDPEDLIQAIQQVHQGESSLHPSIARRLIRRISEPLQPSTELDALTDREVQVLRLVALGKSNREIAERLTISEATVRTHVSNILAKLSLCSRTQAALYALRQGLITLHDTDPVHQN